MNEIHRTIETMFLYKMNEIHRTIEKQVFLFNTGTSYILYKSSDSDCQDF